MVFGSYVMVVDGFGVIDVTARLNRTEARHVARYIPFLKSKVVLDWLDRALLAGRANDVSLRLKGNLKDFPFQSKKDGVFQIAARVADGSLRYAAGWPTLDGIDADLHFDGRRLEVISRKA